ncbi:uncharacterized protein VTP21DRAFT_11270 [Calcarisporiella thermophila]|uniref:uncharacterized protein n=1 Tax=Calcarisporiella thermophila TaxID=911321 RepID=UPI0037423853
MSRFHKVSTIDPDTELPSFSQPSHATSSLSNDLHNDNDALEPDHENDSLTATENNPLLPSQNTTTPPPPQSHSHHLQIHSTDGVFSNLTAKPTTGAAKEDDLPPSYEAAALDAPPPFEYEVTVIPSLESDEILVEGMPVGSLFSFLWNMLISVGFQFVGFMLTYLLHVTHAAKNGSKAGLGLTLIQIGFFLHSRPLNSTDNSSSDDGSSVDPSDSDSSMSLNIGMSLVLMVVGWFILVRAVVAYIQALKMERIIAMRSSEAEAGENSV